MWVVMAASQAAACVESAMFGVPKGAPMHIPNHPAYIYFPGHHPLPILNPLALSPQVRYCDDHCGCRWRISTFVRNVQHACPVRRSGPRVILPLAASIYAPLFLPWYLNRRVLHLSACRNGTHKEFNDGPAVELV